MNTGAGLGEYILQTHNTTFFEDPMGGIEPPNSPLGTPVKGSVTATIENSANRAKLSRMNLSEYVGRVTVFS